MSKLKIKIPSKLGELFDGDARYRVAYGGRGSAKSWSFAQMLIVKAIEKPITVLCTRELQKSIKVSSYRLLKETITRLGVDSYFEVGESFIRGKNGSDFLFMGLKHNPTEVKSTEGIDIAWIEEAHRTSKDSFDLLKNTVRKEGSEIWITFNPEDEDDDVYQRFIVNEPPARSKIVHINYNDNPWFTRELEEERQNDINRDDYNHIWLGEIKKSLESSFYGKILAQLKESGKICSVPHNPDFLVSTWWDIGMSDYTSIWFVQKIGQMFNVIDFFQDNGEDIPYYADKIRSKQYKYSEHFLPHDANHLRQGMGGRTIAEQLEGLLDGKGEVSTTKASANIQSDVMNVRSILPRCSFDKEKCAEGLKMLKNYKKKWNEDRNTFEDKPVHDWASHASDAFRYFAVANVDSLDIAQAYDYNNLTSKIKEIEIVNDFKASDYI